MDDMYFVIPILLKIVYILYVEEGTDHDELRYLIFYNLYPVDLFNFFFLYHYKLDLPKSSQPVW